VDLIWKLIGQYEKAKVASQRMIDLARSLVAEYPNEPKYLAARGQAHLRVGNAYGYMHQHIESEGPLLQAAADFQYLIDQVADDGPYRQALVGVLSNLGLMCSKRNRLDQAESFYQHAIQVAQSVPEPLASSPEVLTSHAGALSNWAMFAHEQGRPHQALALLEKAIALEKQSLENWPDHPEAREFLYAHYWHVADVSLSTGAVESAAKTVETMIQEFLDRLQAYHHGAQFLLRCAELAETSADSAAASQSEMGRQTAAAYRERARELVAEAAKATNPTPEALDRFAWFLSTCKDKSFRDAPRALELARKAVDLAPKRSTNWLGLALAYYRTDDLPRAQEALEKSIELYPEGRGASDPYSGFVGTLIEAKLGHVEKAREWYTHAARCCEPGTPSDPNIAEIAAEAQQVVDALDETRLRNTDNNGIIQTEHDQATEFTEKNAEI
jgi:tetratricopeptide (TPR) repeat protein